RHLDAVLSVGVEYGVRRMLELSVDAVTRSESRRIGPHGDDAPNAAIARIPWIGAPAAGSSGVGVEAGVVGQVGAGAGDGARQADRNIVSKRRHGNLKRLEVELLFTCDDGANGGNGVGHRYSVGFSPEPRCSRYVLPFDPRRARDRCNAAIWDPGNALRWLA